MSAAREAEADDVSAAFHIAVTQIGAATIEDAIRLWQGVPPAQVAATSTAWLRRAIWLVMTRRARSRDLAMAYYRLIRALRTGTTIADPRKPEPAYVTLDMLRREFAALAGPPVSTPTQPPPAEAPAEPEPEARDEQRDDDGRDEKEDLDEDDENDRILVEEIEAITREQERLERTAEDEIRIALQQLGTRNLESKLDDIDTTAPADQVDAAREHAHRQAGARQSAAAERVVLNGARGTVWSTARHDRRTLGYIRVSQSGTPCGWCAMLISRGPVYRSEASATYADGDTYHDNCHCIAVPVFSRDQYASSNAYALNRQYAELWPTVTRGLSGKAALSAWRRFIRDQQKTQARQARPIQTSRRRTRIDRTHREPGHRAAA